ncbi:hypothetical protein [Pseudanabaena sp. BC1403]|uniref:hypothetical protein n=1 Tax=Pseudanabaena sp. BC1403 TaxID=2043171 RepID=UPI000CD97DEE|nr:hypothetical protein [Pseudanabaena sp. BC1403]
MSVNKFVEHILVLPEDDANRQIINGFILNSNVNETAIQVLPIANGWKKVVDKFKNDHVSEMGKFPKRMIVLVIDFDDYKEPDGLSYENRLIYIKSQVPEELQERVFILGSRTAPEKLKNDMKKSFEDIGEALAKDCVENMNETWEHHLLRHNENELKRVRLAVKPFLFN